MSPGKTYDVLLGPDGDLPVSTRHVTGFDATLQRLRRKLGLARGEWFAGLEDGLPFFEWRAQKPPQVVSIGAAVRRAIETVPGVARVSAWTGAFDRETRTLRYTCTVETADGDARLKVFPLGEPGAGNVNPSNRLVIRYARGT